MQPDLLAAQQSPRRSGVGRGVASSLLAWLPALAAVSLTAQIGLIGLRPALLEAQRLEREESRLSQRRVELRDQSAELLAALQAQQDPIYLERERKRLLDPAFGRTRTP